MIMKRWWCPKKNIESKLLTWTLNSYFGIQLPNQNNGWSFGHLLKEKKQSISLIFTNYTHSSASLKTIVSIVNCTFLILSITCSHLTNSIYNLPYSWWQTSFSPIFLLSIKFWRMFNLHLFWFEWKLNEEETFQNTRANWTKRKFFGRVFLSL